MLLRPLDCPHCGAPLPEDAIGTSVTTCPYCERTLAVEPGVVFAKAFARAAKARDEESKAMPNVIRVGDVPYSIEGRIARGESSDVFLARRAHRVTERVVIKVLRALGDAPRMKREAETLRALEANTTSGTAHFSRLIPQLVQHSVVTDDDRVARAALVVRHASGFSATLADARAAYPRGVDPRAAVWMWRRMLELLAWVHGTGRVHGALVPHHVVLHARDHGVMLVDWAASVPFGERLDAIASEHRDFYSDDLSAQPSLDVAMAARCIAFVLGGDPKSASVPSAVPSVLADLVRSSARGASTTDALALHEIVGNAAKQAFGAPTYVPFELPARR